MIKCENLSHQDSRKTVPKDKPNTLHIQGTRPSDDIIDHIELGKRLDLFDFHQATGITGEKFVYMKNEASILEMALTHWAMNHLIERGYTPVTPPDLIRQEVSIYNGVDCHLRDIITI
jgi:seryl-tRNA synthetase